MVENEEKIEGNEDEKVVEGGKIKHIETLEYRQKIVKTCIT